MRIFTIILITHLLMDLACQANGHDNEKSAVPQVPDPEPTGKTVGEIDLHDGPCVKNGESKPLAENSEYLNLLQLVISNENAEDVDKLLTAAEEGSITCKN